MFLDARLDADSQHQTLTMYQWNNVSAVPLYTIANLTTDFVDADLDIDPVASTVTLTAGGQILSVTSRA